MNIITLRGRAWNLRVLDKKPTTGEPMDLVSFDLASFSGGDGTKIDKYTRIVCEAWYKKQAHEIQEGDEIRVFGKLLSRIREKDGKKEHRFFLNVLAVDILRRRELVVDQNVEPEDMSLSQPQEE